MKEQMQILRQYLVDQISKNVLYEKYWNGHMAR